MGGGGVEKGNKERANGVIRKSGEVPGGTLKDMAKFELPPMGFGSMPVIDSIPEDRWGICAHFILSCKKGKRQAVWNEHSPSTKQFGKFPIIDRCRYRSISHWWQKVIFWTKSGVVITEFSDDLVILILLLFSPTLLLSYSNSEKATWEILRFQPQHFIFHPPQHQRQGSYNRQAADKMRTD